MGRDRRRARSARSISITQRRDVVVVVVPSTAQRHDFVIFEGVACVVCERVCGRARARELGKCVCYYFYKGTQL